MYGVCDAYLKLRHREELQLTTLLIQITAYTILWRSTIVQLPR